MAVNNKLLEIRTKLVLKHFEKENYYLFVREDKNDAWRLPSNTLTCGGTIEDSAKKISNSVLFTFSFAISLFCFVSYASLSANISVLGC
jgi:hypothetical protein